MGKIVALIFAILFLPCNSGYAYDEAYGKALRHFGNREYRSAVQYLEEFGSRTPDPAVYYLLGYAYYQLRKFETSRECFDQAYLIDPGFTSDRVPSLAGLSKEDQSLVHDVLQLSGVRKQMEHYAAMVSSSIPQIQQAMSEQRMQPDLLYSMKDSYRISNVYSASVSFFSARSKGVHLAAVIQWLKSPLGRKVSELGTRTNIPESIQRPEAFAGLYETLPEARKLLIRRLESNLHAADLNVEVVSVSLREMLKGMQSQMPDRSKMDSSGIDALADQVRNEPREQLMQHVLMSLSHAYRTLTDEELDAAIRFYETPAGLWFHETSVRALTAALGNASRDMGAKIGKALVLRRIAA